MSIGKLPAGSAAASSRYALASDAETFSNVYEMVGGATFAAALGANANVSVIAVAPAGFTIFVRVVDLTAGGVEMAVVSTVSNVPVALAASFVPADAAARLYSLEIKLSGAPTPADRGVCYQASIEVI